MAKCFLMKDDPARKSYHASPPARRSAKARPPDQCADSAVEVRRLIMDSWSFAPRSSHFDKLLAVPR